MFFQYYLIGFDLDLKNSLNVALKVPQRAHSPIGAKLL